MIIQALSPAQLEATLGTVLVQLITIIVAARLFGALFRRFGQPQVCGEIAAGLVLGPSLLGGLVPTASAVLFDPMAAPFLQVMSQLGLVLLLFLMGMEFDYGHLRTRAAMPVWVSVAGMVVPFGLGLAAAGPVRTHLAPNVEPLGFSLFLGLALSVTSLPVLARILVEFGLNRTRLAAVVMASAAVDDALAWIGLALVTAVVRSAVDVGAVMVMVAQTAGFAAFMVLVARPLLRRWADRVLPSDEADLSFTALGVVLVVIFLAAAITNAIGVFSIFGAFVAGSVLYDHARMRAAVHRRLGDFVTVFFLPIFFTYTGLHTDVRTLDDPTSWFLLGLVLVVAISGKLGACALAARVAGMRWREALTTGVLMNTRGLMALIVINVGLGLGILTQSVFSLLVVMTVLTTYLTSPLLRFLTGASLERRHSHLLARDNTEESCAGPVCADGEGMRLLRLNARTGRREVAPSRADG